MTHRSRSALPLVVVLCLLACLQAGAAPRNFLWKISNARGVIYLAGSVHLLTPDYYPLDPAFDTAFESADLLVEELDMGEMLAPTSQLEMLNRGMMPLGRTLDSVISAATMTAVEKKLLELNMPLAPMKQFKPWLLGLTLQGFEWQKAGFDADLGLDKHFYDRARAAGKRIDGLETIAFQIARFDEMPWPMQERMLAETLKELETTKANVTKIAGAWKAGDVSGIEGIVLQDLKTEPEMYERLLLARNRTWLPKIEALFARPTPAFVVVGAAHVVGVDGLLQMLRAKGYTIEQL